MQFARKGGDRNEESLSGDLPLRVEIETPTLQFHLAEKFVLSRLILVVKNKMSIYAI